MLQYDEKIDYYSILDLFSEATTPEIKKAYRKLALKHHPDKGGDQEQFKMLAAAYEILMDAETKAQYDKESLVHRSTQKRSSSAQESPNDRNDEHSYSEHSNDSNIDSSGSVPNPYSDTKSSDYSHHVSSENSASKVAPVTKSSMIFNATCNTRLFASTSLVQRNHTNDVASAGIKAADMSVTELFNLAMTHEYVALALAKNIDQLKRFSQSELVQLAFKHTSFAYQMLACSETSTLTA
jgi:hypothetical protein